MDAKFEFEEYRLICQEVRDYIEQCQEEASEIEACTIVDTVVNSISISLRA